MRFSHVRELYNEITTYCKCQLLTSEKAVCGHGYGNEKKKACSQTPAHRCNSNIFSFRVLARCYGITYGTVPSVLYKTSYNMYAYYIIL